MSFTSMLYTIGIALDRAREQGFPVEVLVDGQWLGGMVVVSDGVGVVLENHETEHSIIKLDRISAVRVAAAAPMRRKIHAHVGADVAGGSEFDGAMPMPGPRQSSD